MAESPIETCRRAYDLYGRGEIEAMLELFDPGVQVYVGPPNIESGTYRGRDEYADLLVRWGAHWEEMRIEPREMSGHGDWVLALVDYHGRSKESHVAVQQPSWEVSRWSGGRCVEYEVYWDEEDGREAFARRGG